MSAQEMIRNVMDTRIRGADVQILPEKIVTAQKFVVY